MSNKIQNPNFLKTNIECRTRNNECRRMVMVHGFLNYNFLLRLKFCGFVIICFGFCHLTFIWHLYFDICHSNSFDSCTYPLFGVVIKIS